MKRLLLAAVAVALFAVPGLSNAQQKYKFALVPKAMNNPFFDLARDGCMQAMKELPNVECVYIGPAEHTESEQVQIVQDLITKGIDGIAVSSSNAAAMAVALKAAQAANIPVVTWDSDLLPQDQGERAPSSARITTISASISRRSPRG
jgi:ABC-type sugar transport system, periplasmic component